MIVENINSCSVINIDLHCLRLLWLLFDKFYIESIEYVMLLYVVVDAD